MKVIELIDHEVEVFTPKKAATINDIGSAPER